MIGGWAWLTSIMLSVIGRPSIHFGEMSATYVTDVFMVSATNVDDIGNCEQPVTSLCT